TVYCTGRSVRGRPASGDARPETIEETAELVTARGGKGIAVRVDHSVEAEVEALCQRIRTEAGQLDVLVNDIWGGESLHELGLPFWKQSAQNARLMFERAIVTHVITSRHAVPLMLERDRGLIVEVTDGDHFGYRGGVAYDVTKMAVIRLAFAMSRDLRRTNITALAVTPGFLRSEEMLDGFGVTEANWRDGTKVNADFIASETPCYVGRAVAALAADPAVHQRAGRVVASWTLAREYGFTDLDGSQPHWADYFEKAYGTRYPVADEAAYASWFGGPIETALPDWPTY
ncbi:SDR family NAD(P)-dependent oxidoreductase, partial [Corallococcus sp. CA047B]|uniref:SDR family oxidoreductase n=1 Tax=Corallococcus sp. CA047B TaxID=2316729 RepID=UPI000EA03A93